MQGLLSTTPLPEVLRVIYNERRSGELVVKRAGELANIEKHVFFERGQVMFASSSQPEDRIGETLVRYNKLTRQQLEQFFLQLPSGQRIGRALVEQNVLSERELVNYVTLQLIDIIYSLFTWKDGTYLFNNGDNLAPEDLKMKFSTPTIVLEGLRRLNDFELVRRGVGSAAKWLHTTAAGRSKIQAIAFNPLELNLMNMAKEPIDLLRVLVNCKERPEKVLQSVYALLVIGMLEQIDEPATATISAEATQTAPSASSAAIFPGVDITVADLESVRQRIASRDPRVILGVQPQNNINEVYEAYLKLATHFHPDKFANAPKQIKSEIEAIFNSINESYNYIRTAPAALPNVQQPPMQQPPMQQPPMQQQGMQPGMQPPMQQPPMQPPMQPGMQPPMQQPMGNYGGQNPYYPPQVAPQTPSILPNTRLQTGKNPWQTGGMPQAPQSGGYAAPSGYQQQPSSGYQQQHQGGGYYPGNPQTVNPLAALQATKRSSITRAVSDELEYKGEKDKKNPFASLQRGKNIDVQQAISEMLDYFDDRRAPLFTSEALSRLLRTKPPTNINQKDLVETIINWARNKSAVMGWPMAIILLRVITLIKQAEQSQLIEDFDGAMFYPNFIQDLASYCTPPEADEFMRGLSSI